MNQSLRIEYYLMQLDQLLQALPIGQRAEIITEIKSHIHEVLEKEPQRDIETVLGDLGTPHTVAEKYLAAKGLKVSAPRRGRKVFKWLAIGTVAMFLLVFAGGLAVIWRFSPLIRATQHHVTLFNGMIDVNEQLGHVKIGDIEVGNAINEDTVEISGEEDVSGKKVKLIKIPFNNAKLDVESAQNDKMKWSCKTVGHENPKAQIEAGVLSLNLDVLQAAKCSIALPSGAAAEFRGVNGKMEVKTPQNSMKISLVNGKVDISLDPSKVYDFDVKVKNGLQDFFPHSSDKGAVKVQVDVINGLVKKE
jgi:hypothetical protein